MNYAHSPPARVHTLLAFFPDILQDIGSKDSYLKKRIFGRYLGIVSDMFGVLADTLRSYVLSKAKSKERQPSTAKLLRAALATLRPRNPF
jgi:hypothetical protein